MIPAAGSLPSLILASLRAFWRWPLHVSLCQLMLMTDPVTVPQRASQVTWCTAHRRRSLFARPSLAGAPPATPCSYLSFQVAPWHWRARINRGCIRRRLPRLLRPPGRPKCMRHPRCTQRPRQYPRLDSWPGTSGIAVFYHRYGPADARTCRYERRLATCCA